MIQVCKAEERGLTSLDWLDSRHTFSFGDYYDLKHMGFGNLRVINEDRVQPRKGFPPHSHRDMEIISYVLEGALEHKGNPGTGSVIRRGEVQRMSAGRGITHSEFNHSQSEPVHFLQIWILPERLCLAPGYEQETIDLSLARGKFHLIAAREGGQGIVRVHQEAAMWVAILEPDQTVAHSLASGRNAWLQLARGAITVNGNGMRAGDGAAIRAEPELKIEASAGAEILLFDLAPGGVG